MTKDNGIIAAAVTAMASVMMLFFAALWAATGGFASPDQNLVAANLITVRASAPTVNDDIDVNLLRGTFWIDTAGGEVYVSEDHTDGAAVWTAITAVASSSLDAEEDNVLAQSGVTVLDFLSGLDLSCAAGECDITLDYTEDPVILTAASGEVTGSIVSTQLTDGTILEVDLAAVDAASDEECLTFEATGGDFEWQACGAGGGGVDVEEGDSSAVSGATVLDFQAGFDVTEAPAGEANISLDYTEDPVNLASSEVTGTLPAANGGTGQTAATADAVLVANGSAYVARVIPDCDANTGALNFDQTTDAWTCRNAFAFTTDDITDDSLLEADLDAVDTPADEECLTYESGAGGDFEWQTCGAGGGGTASHTFVDGVTQVADADYSGTVPGLVAVALGSTLSMQVDLQYWVPFMPLSDIQIGDITYYLSTAGAASTVIRVCLYEINEAFDTFTLIEDYGTGAADTTGSVTISPTTNETLTGGTLYAWAYASDGTPAARGMRVSLPNQTFTTAQTNNDAFTSALFRGSVGAGACSASPSGPNGASDDNDPGLLFFAKQVEIVDTSP